MSAAYAARAVLKFAPVSTPSTPPGIVMAMVTLRLVEPVPGPVQAAPRASATRAVVPARGASRRRRRGRRPLLYGPKRETFLAAIRAGNRVAVAATYAGISGKTVREWICRGEGRDARPAIEPYITFAREVDQAMAHAEVAALLLIRRAMARDWRAAAWFLENTCPEWRRRRDPGEMAEPAKTAPPQDYILIDGATLRRIAGERIAAERGDADVDEATLGPASPTRL